MTRSLDVAVEHWPIAGAFAISRGSKTTAEVVVATVRDGRWNGRGECVPYGRYGETVPDVVAALEAAVPLIAGGGGRAELMSALPAGAARNAIDCALFELEAKSAGTSVARLAGLAPLRPVVTAYTISLDSAAAMAAAAGAQAARPLLKLKLGGDGDPERLAAVRVAAPDSELIVDANEAWTTENFATNMAAAAAAGVRLIEQPLPAGADAALADFDRPVPICADESFHGLDDLPTVARLYQAINIKLDKTGGLTAALAVQAAAEALGLDIMVGCMVGTSLAMAPAVLLAQRAQFVDLDGPLLLARDRAPGLVYDGSRLLPPTAALWGGAEAAEDREST